MGDKDVARAIKMRKAAAVAFHAADCDQALRAATLAGSRKVCDFEVGQAVYFWRRGAGSTKKTRQSYWQGPGRVVMTSLPNAVWIAHGNMLVKASPERVRHASSEENLSVSGWLRGISKTRQDFEKIPRKGFVDLTVENPDEAALEQPDDPLEEDGVIEPVPPGILPAEDAPVRRVRQKTSMYSNIRPEPREEDDSQPTGPNEPLEAPELLPSQANEPPLAPSPPPGLSEMELDMDLDFDNAGLPEAPGSARATGSSAGTKREGDDQTAPPGRRSRVALLEAFHLHLQGLSKQRQKKESKASDFKGKDFDKLQKAILKEINNNLATQAYEILSKEASEEIMRTKPEKVMESRYVITKKPLEPSEVSKAESEGILLADYDHGPCKAKCRHVMRGYSEESALDVEFTTPQITRDSVIFILQILSSFTWTPGFVDFTQAFHSGDWIQRELYCSQPREGIPGMHPKQLLRLLKTCYGLTDGPLAWYKHLARRLQQLGYEVSKADPCVFFLRGPEKEGSKLEGIIGVATDDLLHGGTERHWSNIATIAQEYKLGKNQQGAGRFTGKDIALQDDGSILVNQQFYVEDKVKIISLDRKRKQQRYSRCTPAEVESLRSSLGVLSWLAKETRCDLAGRVALLQQAFPEPQVRDLIEANKISEEARKESDLGIKIMPIPVESLRVSVVTDAAWGNSRETPWLEDHPDDYWEEKPECWIRHHVQPRRTTYHPGSSPDGPDLHRLSGKRTIYKFQQTQGQVDHQVIEDNWAEPDGIRVLQDTAWTGSSWFWKDDNGGVPASKIHSSWVQLQNLSSQGGQIVIYHDKKLSEAEEPAMTTVASWRSYRLKRKTVDTLAAEGQALQSGLGSVHWHRLLFMEALYGDLKMSEWRAVAGRLPFLAAVDSKSLFDAVNKCACTAAYVSDKRTAIDLAVIKSDLLETSGTIRWVDTRSMISDPLTKQHPGTYLKYVLRKGYWSVMEEGHALQIKALEREAKRASENLFLTVWEFRV